MKLVIKALLDVVESGNKNIELMVITGNETRTLTDEEIEKLIDQVKQWFCITICQLFEYKTDNKTKWIWWNKIKSKINHSSWIADCKNVEMGYTQVNMN